MTTQDSHTTAPGAHAAVSETVHPANPPYMIIWVVLLVLTLAEVGYAFLNLPKVWLAVGLIAMAFWKAAMVAAYYMHLKWEPRRLMWLALSPLPLIAILILVVMTEY
jgi:cytochrome c oxidase subunit IV